VTPAQRGYYASRRRGALSDSAIRPSVCLSHGAAALGYRHAGCLQLSHVYGLRTRPRTNVDPPRVELPSAGAYRLGAITCSRANYQCCRPSTSPHLLLSAGAYRRHRLVAGTRRRRRPQLSVDISCSQGAQQQTSRKPLLLSTDGTDGWNDGGTDGHPTVIIIDLAFRVGLLCG